MTTEQWETRRDARRQVPARDDRPTAPDQCAPEPDTHPHRPYGRHTARRTPIHARPTAEPEPREHDTRGTGAPTGAAPTLGMA